MACAGIVLCGGRSTRMGRAKAWLPWRGRPMVAHVVTTLRSCEAIDEIVVVSSAELPLPPLDATIARDREPALGPLAGLREGLSHIQSDRAFATSTDAPFLTPGFVTALLSIGDAAAPEIDGFVQTLSAVYPRRALPIAQEMIEAGRLRPRQLLEAVGYRKLQANELPEIESTRGFNTPDEYLQAVTRDAPDATASLELHGALRQAAGRGEWVVPVGTLAAALARLPSGCVELDPEDGSLAGGIEARLSSGETTVDTRIPIGPDERIALTDAAS